MYKMTNNILVDLPNPVNNVNMTRQMYEIMAVGERQRGGALKKNKKTALKCFT